MSVSVSASIYPDNREIFSSNENTKSVNFIANSRNISAGISDKSSKNLTPQTISNTVDSRRLDLLQHKIDKPWPNPLSSDPETRKWGYPTYALAALYMNQNLQTANDYINAWYNEFPVLDSPTIEKNADFKLNMFWRIYLNSVTGPRLSPETRDNIEDMMWRWINQRSKLSDAEASTWNYHGSENHDAMQKGSYLLCAQALKNAGAPYGPDRTLADGRTIAEHASGWSNYFIRYFADRASEGINAEIASPTYAKYSVGVYFNIRDHAESIALRTLADRFLSLYWADTANDWIASGVRAGGSTRCYKGSTLRRGSAASFNGFLWVYNWPGTTSGNVHPVILHGLTSTYRVPEVISAIARDRNRPNYLYTSRRWGLSGAGKSGDINYIGFDNGDSYMLRDTWVTPDYAMGTITFDMNRDYLQIIDQNRAMGVMFASGIDHRVMVFGKGASNNKSYADLTGITGEDCIVVYRDKNANSSGNGTLIFVPASLYEPRIESSGWLFLQAGNAYCAIRPAAGGYSVAVPTEGIDYDLQLGDLWAPVVIQTGQAANYKDFADFQSSVMANSFTYSSGILNYTSEAGHTFTIYANSKNPPRVNGTEVNLNPVNTYDSPYLSMVHGEPVATVRYPGYEDLVLDFNSPRVLEWMPDAVMFSNDWFISDTFGWFQSKPGSNWIYHLEHGWQLCQPVNQGFFLYDQLMASWFYSDLRSYPWMYKFGAISGWYFFYANAQPGNRLFFYPNSQSIVSESSINQEG